MILSNFVITNQLPLQILYEEMLQKLHLPYNNPYNLFLL